jgi:hypothetical protein
MTQPLNDVMEFDHVVTVHADGTVTDGPSNLYAPSLYDEELDSDDWELLTGYTGQYSYNGPIMHNSEFIGGGLERDILAEPGIYVSLVAHWTFNHDCPFPDDCDGIEGKRPFTIEIEGWAIARYVGEGV